MIPSSVPGRRYAVFAEGRFLDDNAKTAHGLLRYGKDEVVTVIDSTLAGRTPSTLCRTSGATRR